MLVNGSFPLDYSLNTEEEVDSLYYVSEQDVQTSKTSNAFEVKKKLPKPKIVKRYTIKKKTVSKENLDMNIKKIDPPKSSKTMKTHEKFKMKKNRKMKDKNFSEQSLKYSNFNKTKLVSICGLKSETEDDDEKG